MVCGNMEVEAPASKSAWDSLYEPDKVEDTVRVLKNSIIGSRRQKEQVVEQRLHCRLLNILADPDISTSVKINVVHIIYSLSKSRDLTVNFLSDQSIIQLLVNGILSQDLKMKEACLSTLVSIFDSSDNCVDIIYSDSNLLSHILSLINCSSTCTIMVCNLLVKCCRSPMQQAALIDAGTLEAIAQALSSPVFEAQLAALKCLALLLYKNEVGCAVALSTTSDGKSLTSLVIQYTGRCYDEKIQLEACRILTFMFRCEVMEWERLLVYRVLPTLVRLTKPQEQVETRILAAETLAYLIEVNVEFQQIASISNHLVTTVAAFLKWEPEPKQKSSGLTRAQQNKLTAQIELEQKQASDLKKAAFHVFASLAANDEDIRKRLIETPPIISTLVTSLQEPDIESKMPAIRCLHSLSRSVQLLRTTFQDYVVWEPLMKILSCPAAKVESVLLASSTLCNMLLDFSPSKESILDSGAVDVLCELTRKQDPALRLNGVWGLMNLSFNSEQRIKSQIMTTIGTDQVFRLLSDTEMQVVMKTLGLLRNLLSNDKHHIDQMTSLYGKQLMQAVVFILESENSQEVKEQALCMLANIADGDTSKKLIMDNEDMMKKLKSYMQHFNPNLQTAAVVCIQNLIWKDDEGSQDRQAKLKEIGVFNILKQLLVATDDTVLSEKVRVALSQQEKPM